MPPTQPDSLLELRDIRAGYGPNRVLNGVSLKVSPGSVVAMIGANGAGKTTTLNVISGIVPVTAGGILLDGKPVRPANDTMVELGVAHSPEGRRMFPQMTVLDNLLTGAHVRRDQGEINADLATVFSYFPILKDRADQRAGTLSGGEQQMAAIARALMSRPRLLLLDEPTLGLAPKIIDAVGDIIARIAGSGLAILLVEQNASLALDLAQYGYVLEEGSVVLEGPSAKLRNDDRVRAAYLSAA